MFGGREHHGLDTRRQEWGQCGYSFLIRVIQKTVLGEFLLLDSKDFKVKGKWNADECKTDFAYDYWYQPRKNVMLSTEWGSPNKIKTGFNPAHVGEGKFNSQRDRILS